MAGARLGAALRHIQRLFTEGSATGVSDTQLLVRFAVHRDEAAFAALMARHGPMVMTVCRGVLRDSLDAEDAFQATFLVLARKAGSAWAEGGLGGWLHRVAYRIAVKASIDATRRRAHERRVAEVLAMESSQFALDTDLHPALHEELARLPSKLRVPVVLCYLEGQTQAQAALQLRCGEATLRRRLAGARERLRDRLVRRGFAPSAMALGLSAAREAGAVPPACAEATIRAVMRIAAGEAIATVVSARLANMTRPGLTVMTEGWKAASIVLAGAAIACLAAGIGTAGGKSQPLGKAQAKLSPPPNAQAQPVPPKKSSRKHTIKGTVIAPDGKPLPDATVYWFGYPRFLRSRMARPKGSKAMPEEQSKSLGIATTDAGGRFELTAEFDQEGFLGRQVVVKAKGAGLSAKNFFGETIKDGEQLTFRLRAPATIEGRLLTAEGSPAVGVKVLLEDFRDTDNELEGEMLSCGPIDEPNDNRPDYWPGSWTTGADGRFRIEGIVPEKMFARLHFRDPNFADDNLIVSTGLALTDWLRAFGTQPVDAKFTHTLEPARPVVGVITDKQTGKPLAGVLVEMLPARMTNRYGGMTPTLVKTDASGRYRAAGASGDNYWVSVFPEPGSGYLPLLKRDNRWPSGMKVLTIDLALPRGRVVRGRVVEGHQARPVPDASVIYQPGPNNPHDSGNYEFRNPVLTDSDGNFALTALPGKGLLAVEAAEPDFIRVPITGGKVVHSSIARPHAFARLDLPAGNDKVVPVTLLTIRKGVNLEARLLGPDGKPLEMVMGWYAELMASQLQNWVSPQPFLEGHFRIEGADPSRAYRVFLLDTKRRLGAVAELKFDPKRPATVRLEPTATAKGIMVDRKGRPLEGKQILAWMVLTNESRELTAQDFFGDSHAVVYNMFTSEPLLPTNPAAFNFGLLIPGVRYYVGSSGKYHAVAVMKPGEVRDLGKITIKDPQEAD